MADFVQLKHPEYQSMHARPDGEVREETADIESRCTTSTGGGDDGGVRVGTWMNQGLLRVSQARNGRLEVVHNANAEEGAEHRPPCQADSWLHIRPQESGGRVSTGRDPHADGVGGHLG